MFFKATAGVAHLVERRLAKAEVAGSSPVFRSIYALLAQSVEHLTLKQGVRGSSPRRRTINPINSGFCL